MSGNAPRLPEFLRVVRAYDALLYIDDAHGFGVIGERRPDETCPYGRAATGSIRHFDESYDNVVLVAGFSKAYSSLLAFIACPTELKNLLKVAAPPYLYSGPSPVASLATVLAGFEVNERRGDELRVGHLPHDRRRAGRARGARRRDAEPLRAPDHRGPARPTTSRSTRSAGSCSTVGSTSRSPRTRWCRSTRSGSASRSPRRTPTSSWRRLVDVLTELSQRFELQPAPRRARFPSRASGRPRNPMLTGTAVRDVGLRGVPLHRWYLAIGGALLALYLLVPPFQGSPVLINFLSGSSAVAIVVGVRRNRPSRPGRGCCSRSARRCSSSGTSTPTSIRSCSATRFRSRRSATGCTSRCTRC